MVLLLICPFMHHKWMSQHKINKHLVLWVLETFIASPRKMTLLCSVSRLNKGVRCFWVAARPSSELARRSTSVWIPAGGRKFELLTKTYNKNPRIVAACYDCYILDTKNRFVKTPNSGFLTILPRNAAFLVLNRDVLLAKPSNEGGGGGGSSNRRLKPINRKFAIWNFLAVSYTNRSSDWARIVSFGSNVGLFHIWHGNWTPQVIPHSVPRNSDSWQIKGFGNYCFVNWANRKKFKSIFLCQL